MSTIEDILARTRRQPFVPFRIVTTTGQTYDIYHPDGAMATRRYVVVLVPTPAGELPDRHTEIAMLHVNELQVLPTPAPIAGTA